MLYVAYGSNMNLEQMSYRCPKAKVIGNGKLNGWKLVFNCHADIVKKNNSEVPVVVWDINDEYEWYRLDMYEGYPHYYIRKTVDVVLDNGTKEKAIVYVMADDRKGISPPSKGYFDGIIKGCIANKINTEYLYDALDYSFENETEYNQYNKRG
jgi:gamma-glutamylcyclotransferase (GGCT)/AIG2-like uncharacterized protein YtfP